MGDEAGGQFHLLTEHGGHCTRCFGMREEQEFLRFWLVLGRLRRKRKRIGEGRLTHIVGGKGGRGHRFRLVGRLRFNCRQDERRNLLGPRSMARVLDRIGACNLRQRGLTGCCTRLRLRFLPGFFANIGKIHGSSLSWCRRRWRGYPATRTA
jgi:hypothetical protein